MKSCKKADIIWPVAFAAMFALVVYKCRFGFGDRDETYYLTTPYRLLQGDSLLFDEYNGTQLSSLVMYPIFQLYYLISGTLEGSVLVFRYIYTILHGATAVFIYVKLRRFSAGAGVASLLYLLYTPYGIMALSYNSMCAAFMCIAGVLLYCNTENRLSTCFIAGLAFSGAVLCCPALVLLYIAYGIGILIYHIIRKRVGKETSALKCFLVFSLACAAAAAVFAVYVLCNASLSDVLTALPTILFAPEAAPKTLGKIVSGYFRNIFGSNNLAVTVIILAATLCLMYLADKKKQERLPVYTLGTVAVALIYVLPFLTTKVYINYLMLPLTAAGLICVVLLGKKAMRELVFLCLAGVGYGMCAFLVSNQQLYIISHASLVSSVGGILLLAKLFGQLRESESGSAVNKAAGIGIAGLLCFMLAAVCVVRYNSLYWEDGSSMSDMSHEITVGANKGILTTAEKQQDYEELYAEVQSVREFEAENVLYYSTKPWLYLEDSKRNACYSGWVDKINDISSDKLLDYYSVHPHKLPDIIYCSKEDWDSSLSIAGFIEENRYTLTETEKSLIFIRNGT